jgi:hypothetical protein
MATFEIYNLNAGEVLGRYEASDADSALDVMARDYGFANYAAVVADYGVSVEEAKGELEVTEVAS